MIETIDTPCGRVWIRGDSARISDISWEELDGIRHGGELDWIVVPLRSYFEKTCRVFPGALSFHEGRLVWSRAREEAVPETLFHRVLSIMCGIPYGHTAAYSDIARMAGNRYLARAVGHACGRNPLPVIVPCHRIVSRHGLGGYSSGIYRKEYLLKLEGIL